MADLLSLPAAEEAQGRRRQMLRTAFGPTIAAALADPAVIEVMVNYGQNILTAARALEQINNQVRQLQNQLLMIQRMDQKPLYLRI